MRFCWLLLFSFWLVPFFAHILFLIIIILLYSWMLVCPSSFLWLFCQFIIYASCYFELFFWSQFMDWFPILFCSVLSYGYSILHWIFVYITYQIFPLLMKHISFYFFCYNKLCVPFFFISCCAQVLHIYTILSIFFSRSCFIYTYAL